MRSLLFAALLSSSILLLALSCNNESKKDTTTDTTQLITPDTGHTMMADTNKPLVRHAEAVISGTYADTVVNGKAVFDTDSDTSSVKMVLEVTIPSKAKKSVAVHFHEHGDCGDTAKLAHGHWNPTNEQHGKWGTGNYHSGDIGNIKLDSKGMGKITLQSKRWTLGGMPSKNILGKSIIVHGGTDDYTTQPSGNSGSRIGCGVIQ